MRALARGAHTEKSNRLGRLPTLRVWLRHAVATARPLRIARDYGGFAPSPRPSPSGEGGEGSRPLRRGTGRRERRPGHPSEAHPRPKEPPQAHRESTPPEGTGKFPLDKLSAVVVQLSTRGRIGSGGIRCPPASARESRSGKSPEGYISLPGFYSTPHCPPARPSPHPMRLTQQNLLILLRSSCRTLMRLSDKHPRLGVSPLGFIKP